MPEGEITLGVLGERLNNLISSHKEMKKDNEEAHVEMRSLVKATNGRVRALEKWMWGLGSVITFIGFCITIYVTIHH